MLNIVTDILKLIYKQERTKTKKKEIENKVIDD